MKKIFSVMMMVGTMMMVQSCANYYHFVQVVETKPVEENSGLITSSSGYDFHNDDITICYHMWSNLGKTYILVYNNTDQLMYVDMTKSFFIKNKLAIAYYDESERIETYTDVFTYAYASTSTIYNSMIQTVTSKTSITSSEKEKMIVVPAKTYRLIDMFQILNEHLLDCDLINYPSDKTSITYTTDNTPVLFANYMTYRIGENTEEKNIHHEFYVSTVTNLARPLYTVYEKRDNKRCDAIMTPTERQNENYKEDVYDAYITVPTDGCFYSTYSIMSHDKLYQKPAENTYYWNDQYQGYTSNSDTNSPFNFSAPTPKNK